MNRPIEPITEEQMLLVASGEADAELSARVEELARRDGSLRDRIAQLRRIDASARQHVPDARVSVAQSQASIERALKSARQAANDRTLRREAAIPKGPIPRWAWAAGTAVAAMVALMVWVANREPSPLDGLPDPNSPFAVPLADIDSDEGVPAEIDDDAFALLAVFDDVSAASDSSWNELESVYALRSDIQQ
jgi:anti-sigma factor RsiW